MRYLKFLKTLLSGARLAHSIRTDIILFGKIRILQFGVRAPNYTVPYHFVYDPTSCTLFQNPSVAYFLLLLNHIDVCKPNSLIQYSEVVLELSSNNKIYRNRAGGLVWRPERSGKEFNHLFASCNCSTSVAIIASPLVSFECLMTVKSCYSVYLIVSG
jgi:hypothetical protein